MSSNIRISVEWRDSTVFAGEEVECTITFKNVAKTSVRDRSPNPNTNGGVTPRVGRQLTPKLQQSARPSMPRNHSASTLASAQYKKGHRPVLSLYAPSSASVSTAGGQHAPPNGASGSAHKHGRSLSIISLGSAGTGDARSERGLPPPSQRPARGHGRSASLQVLPGRKLGSPVMTSPGSRSTAFHSPTLENHSPIHEQDGHVPSRHPRRTSTQDRVSTLAGERTGATTRGARQRSDASLPNFSFPAAPAPDGISHDPHKTPEAPQIYRTKSSRANPSRHHEDIRIPSENLSPITRILAGTSMNGSERSSGEFYSMSNNSTETLASEYVAHPSARLLPRVTQSNQNAHVRNQPRQPVTEILMMGYAQIMGTFMVDGSLINQAPFEEVKRKGVVGGQGGGGVVGVERTKRESGLFGSFGWGTIGESLGGLLGNGEPSSIREMRGIASSKTIPLLSTPQSILFVDLRLAPGESKSYKYSFTLPRGLPPSHKGRAMKANYHITIGTQRPGGSVGQQQVKNVDLPFRVMGSVTSKYSACSADDDFDWGILARGEILGHDLMSPYIILRDQARTEAIEAGTPNKERPNKATASTGSDAASHEFLDYVDKLLDRPTHDMHGGLLSPTDPGLRRKSSFMEEPKSMKEAIDLAILRSNTAAFSPQSTNKFEIARSGRHVAVIMLARPAYRLGETITAVINFQNASIPTYSVLVTLESSEKVDGAIALRSNSSIYRATRKVHASYAENALFAHTLTFTPTVPPHATPEFITSGVSLEWKMRIEFTTPRLTGEEGEEELLDELLEEIANDDRGIVLAATERLPCETFEVAVPIRVYGAVIGGIEGQNITDVPV